MKFNNNLKVKVPNNFQQKKKTNSMINKIAKTRRLFKICQFTSLAFKSSRSLPYLTIKRAEAANNFRDKTTEKRERKKNKRVSNILSN